MPDTWNAVDDYLSGLFVGTDDALDHCLLLSADRGLPEIAVSAPQGKQLNLLALATGARRILEIGTLGGYSAIWLARALPADGQLVTLELSPKHAATAAENLAYAGLADRVQIRVGPASSSLRDLAAEGQIFDMIFIDADKGSYPAYLTEVLPLCHQGSLIVGDNIVRGGRLTDAGSDDPNVLGVREFTRMMAAEPRVSATVIQTVGSKGYDGFSLAVVTR